MNSVVIAGCGDLGSAVGVLLAESGSRVWGLRRSEAPAVDGIHMLAVDLTQPDRFPELPAADCVVYCPTPDQRDEAGYRSIFVQGQQALLQALPARPRHLLFVSSSAVYGQDDGSWIDEDSPCEPGSFRGRVLLEAEQVTRSMSGSVLRLAGIYGPGRNWLINRVRSGAEAQQTPPYWTNRIHRDDAARLIVHLLPRLHEHASWIGVDDQPATQWEVCQWLADRMGLPPVPARIGGGSNKRLSNRRIRETGFKFRYPNYRSGYERLIAAGGAELGGSE